MDVRPAKTQISLGIRPVWSESLLCAQWVAKESSLFFMRTAKTLIRLGGCRGWSESSLGAHAILLNLSCTGSNTFANNVDPDKVTYNEPSHLNLHCFLFCCWLFDAYPYLQQWLCPSAKTEKSTYGTQEWKNYHINTSGSSSMPLLRLNLIYASKGAMDKPWTRCTKLIFAPLEDMR